MKGIWGMSGNDYMGVIGLKKGGYLLGEEEVWSSEGCLRVGFCCGCYFGKCLEGELGIGGGELRGKGGKD